MLTSKVWQIWLLSAGYGIYYEPAEMVVCTFVADLVPDGKKGIAYGLYLIVADLTISRAT